MLFHTHEFLTLLALTLLLFWKLPTRRHLILLCASIAFYAYAGLGMLILFLIMAAITYGCLRAVESGHRWALPLGVSLNLANLFTFKYTLFVLDTISRTGLDLALQREWVAASIVLPVGISFYTFQLIAVLVDSARGATFRIRDFREFLLFITFFAQLIAGPIMRGAEFFPQLHRLRLPTQRQLASGVVLFGLGLVKKVVFADMILAPRVDVLFASATEWDAPSSWLLGLLFGFQIYYDFSGYVDMALGLGRMFGLELMPNFATPYVSRTPSEFWSRWNITLSRWFGDYLYIPLGGSRRSSWLTIRNLMVTMLASGLWHGAGFTFLIWGGVHGVYLSLYHSLRRLWPALANRMATGYGPAAWSAWIITFIVTLIGWVYFRATSVGEANAVVASMFGFGSGSRSADLLVLGSLAGLLLALHFFERLWMDSYGRFLDRMVTVWRLTPGPVQAIIVFAALVVGVGLTKQVEGAFIYFQF